MRSQKKQTGNFDLQNSPEVTRSLYSTGFVFKNNNSPIACDFKLS